VSGRREECDELVDVREKVRALVMRKEVVGLVAVASERRKIERVIDAIVDFVECFVMYKKVVKRAIEQHNSNERASLQ
jgi:uncharacterized protein YlxP (DUF503 family)